MIKPGFILLLFVIALSCGSKTEVITIKERELIPEGITIGERGEIYLSNIYAKNIIRTKADGADLQVIETKYTGEFSGVGITQKNGLLYALANTNERSVLQIIDLRTGQLIDSYVVADSLDTFFNDLAVTRSGEIFFTDTNLSRVNTIRNDSVVVFIESEEIQYPNGIALADDEKRLYIASFTKGIRIYDFKSDKFVNEADSTRVTRAIDGLKYYRNSLIGIQNASRNLEEHAIVRFYLDNTSAKITGVDTLFVNHPTFNVPTTFDIQDGWVYCLANSQLDNLDQEKMQLINPDELTDTFILKLKIE